MQADITVDSCKSGLGEELVTPQSILHSQQSVSRLYAARAERSYTGGMLGVSSCAGSSCGNRIDLQDIDQSASELNGTRYKRLVVQWLRIAHLLQCCCEVTLVNMCSALLGVKPDTLHVSKLNYGVIAGLLLTRVSIRGTGCALTRVKSATFSSASVTFPALN